jgi:hypothetical protein
VISAALARPGATYETALAEIFDVLKLKAPTTDKPAAAPTTPARDARALIAEAERDFAEGIIEAEDLQRRREHLGQ